MDKKVKMENEAKAKIVENVGNVAKLVISKKIVPLMGNRTSAFLKINVLSTNSPILDYKEDFVSNYKIVLFFFFNPNSDIPKPYHSCSNPLNHGDFDTGSSC